MNIDILTKNDMDELRQLLVSDLKETIGSNNYEMTDWIRSAEVQDILKCSSSTLQNFRANNILPYTKLGGTLYYDKSEIEGILKKKYNERNTK